MAIALNAHKMPWSDYFDHPFLNKSAAMHLLRSPAHFQAYLQAERKETPAFNRGLAMHAKLAGERDTVAVAPDVDRRTKIGKEAWAAFQLEAAGKIVVTPDVDLQTDRMAEAIARNGIAGEYLRTGEHELSIFFDFDGVACKARIDCLLGDAIVDWKGAADIEAFARSAAAYHYDLQAAWYSEAARAVTGKALPFVFVVVEDAPPYGVKVFQAGETMLERGLHNMRRCVDLYRQCKQANDWPGYPAEIETLELPAWAQLEVGDVIQFG